MARNTYLHSHYLIRNSNSKFNKQLLNSFCNSIQGQPTNTISQVIPGTLLTSVNEELVVVPSSFSWYLWVLGAQEAVDKWTFLATSHPTPLPSQTSLEPPVFRLLRLQSRTTLPEHCQINKQTNMSLALLCHEHDRCVFVFNMGVRSHFPSPVQVFREFLC